jgi:flavorubredoxin
MTGLIEEGLKGGLLMKVFVAYDSQYGNTKLVAEKIAEGMKETEGMEVALGYVKEVDPSSLAGYDALLLGAPNHMGRPSRTMKKFVDQLTKVELKARSVAVFGTYAGRTRAVDRAVEKMEKTLAKKLPKLKLISQGLSVKVNGVTGPVVEGELPKCVDFGKRIAQQLKSQ